MSLPVPLHLLQRLRMRLSSRFRHTKREIAPVSPRSPANSVSPIIRLLYPLPKLQSIGTELLLAGSLSRAQSRGIWDGEKRVKSLLEPFPRWQNWQKRIHLNPTLHHSRHHGLPLDRQSWDQAGSIHVVNLNNGLQGLDGEGMNLLLLNWVNLAKGLKRNKVGKWLLGLWQIYRPE